MPSGNQGVHTMSVLDGVFQRMAQDAELAEKGAPAVASVPVTEEARVRSVQLLEGVPAESTASGLMRHAICKLGLDGSAQLASDILDALEAAGKKAGATSPL